MTHGLPVRGAGEASGQGGAYGTPAPRAPPGCPGEPYGARDGRACMSCSARTWQRSRRAAAVGLPRRARGAARSSGPGRWPAPSTSWAATEVAGCGAGESGAVPGEVGHQEGPQPGGLAHRLVEGLGEAMTVLDILGRGGTGVEGEGEAAADAASAPNTMPPRDPYGVGMRRRYALIRPSGR
ncbi:hypothetical protein STANM309S_01792 [Streptomyces tanashiensis]